MKLGIGGAVDAILKQAKARGWSIARGGGSIVRLGAESAWIVRNITKQGERIPDKLVTYSMLSGWSWVNVPSVSKAKEEGKRSASADA